MFGPKSGGSQTSAGKATILGLIYPNQFALKALSSSGGRMITHMTWLTAPQYQQMALRLFYLSSKSMLTISKHMLYRGSLLELY